MDLLASRGLCGAGRPTLSIAAYRGLPVVPPDQQPRAVASLPIGDRSILAEALHRHLGLERMFGRLFLVDLNA